MNPSPSSRNKLLLAVLGLALAAWQVPTQVNHWVLEPVATRQADLEKLGRSLEDRELDKRRQRKAAKTLADLGRRSLPPDPVIAAGVFQNWLHEMSAAAQLTNVVVDRPQFDKQKKENTYFLVHGLLKGQGTLGQVTSLLRKFQESGLLIRITNLKLESQRREGDPSLKIELSVDGMALLSSPPRTTLWVDGEAPGPLPRAKSTIDSEQAESERALAAISKKNLFVRGYNGPPKPPAPPPVEPPPPTPPAPSPTEPSTAEYVYLVGSVLRNGVADAYLYDRSSNKQTVLKSGGEFKAGGMEGKVVKIAAKSVTLQVGEDEFKLELGKNLTQMQKLPKPEPAKEI